jgi:hypothetical protein
VKSTGLFARRMLLAIAVTACSAPPTPAAAQTINDQYQLLRQNLITSFSLQKLVPIITSRGELVGDVYDINDFTLLSRAANCFPTLVQPKAVPTTLPTVVDLGQLDVSLAVGAPELGKVQGELQGARAIRIRYLEPAVQVASAADLQKAFSAKNCRSLEPVVKGKYVQDLPAAWPLVVAEVYYAKREVTISSGDKQSAEVAVSGLTALLKKLKLDFSASAGADQQKGQLITLQSTIALPVAVRPAFLPRKFTGYSLGADDNGSAHLEGAQWAIFDPKEKPSQNALFDQLIAAGACKSIACFKRGN